MKIAANSKLVMIGDSITDVGRKQPEGEGLGEALGRGYVAYVDALLTSAYPERQIRVINKGCGGHQVTHLAERWQRDVLDLQPHWVSIMIGINDVWRQYDQPLIPESHVYLDVYERTLDDLVAQTLPVVKVKNGGVSGGGLVLLTPYYMELNRKDLMRATMDKYGSVVKKIAKKHGTLCVDVQAAFEPILTHFYPATLGWDRVHPNASGHMAIARAFLNAVEFDWKGQK